LYHKMYGCHVQTGGFFVGFIPSCFTVEFTSTADLETVRNSLEIVSTCRKTSKQEKKKNMKRILCIIFMVAYNHAFYQIDI
jgi:hypothetical protein